MVRFFYHVRFFVCVFCLDNGENIIYPINHRGALHISTLRVPVQDTAVNSGSETKFFNPDLRSLAAVLYRSTPCGKCVQLDVIYGTERLAVGV